MTKKATLLALEVVFFTIIIVVTWINGTPVVPSSTMLVLFALATMRSAHTISYNEIAEWLREPFCYVKRDSCKAGADVHARTDRGGFVEAVGGLLSCSAACTPTWTALALYSTWLLFPDFGTVLTVILGLAGASEVLHYVTNFFEWAARLVRVKSGEICPDEE